MNKKKIIIYLTNSLGELDVVLPICIELKKKYNLKIEIIFTVKSIYKKFIQNELYIYFFKNNKISYSYIFLKNKFDLPNNYNQKQMKIIKIYFLFLTLLSLPKILLKMLNADYFFYEFSEQEQIKYIYLMKINSNIKIFTYCHGVALHPDIVKGKIKKYANKTTYLLFNEMNRPLSDSLGYFKTFTIGIPKFYSNWKNCVNNLPSNLRKNEKFVLVFTRSINDYYMPYNIYEEILIETYAAIRSTLGDIKVIFKPHPRENIKILKNIIKENRMQRTEISFYHSTILAKDSLLAISHWTSCVIDCLSVNTPVIEYFKESKKFRELEKMGSVYKKIGFVSCNDVNELKKNIKKIINGLYTLPKNLYDIYKSQNISFLE